MGDDLRLGRQHVGTDNVIAVIVAIDDFGDGRVGHGSDGGLVQRRHVTADRIDSQHPIAADHKRADIKAGPPAEEINAFPQIFDRSRVVCAAIDFVGGVVLRCCERSQKANDQCDQSKAHRSHLASLTPLTPGGAVPVTK